MPRYRVLPYRQGSKGAKALADALGGKVLKLQGSSFVPKPADVIIGWGYAGEAPWNLIGYHFNSFNCDSVLIKKASNKLNFFRMMRDEGYDDIIPAFWENKDDIPDDAFPIVCRTVLAGHSGDGIVIANTRDDLVSAPLYVAYVKKQDEYRIHVGMKDGEASLIAAQRKARRLDTPSEEVNWQVRNHANGFVFVRQDVNPPDAVFDVARKALAATGLDFGAVDVIWNAQKGKAYVLEINTAPGLEGQTVDDYAAFFKGL